MNHLFLIEHILSYAKIKFEREETTDSIDLYLEFPSATLTFVFGKRDKDLLRIECSANFYSK